MNQHPAYELFEELGRGANTVVYRSYDLSLGREVAIKELDENSRRDPRQREQFLREAQFLAQFEHDNVLRVYSVDPERGWIVMELMKGTLASIIAAGPSDPDLVRSVLKQTLDALAFLHEKNKVHGTVRPTNLLINECGPREAERIRANGSRRRTASAEGEQEISGARVDQAGVRRLWAGARFVLFGFHGARVVEGAAVRKLVSRHGQRGDRCRYRLAAVAQFAG